MDDETRKEVLGEAMMSQFEAIRENTDQIPEIKADLKDVKERVERLEEKMDIVSDAVREHIADKSLHR